MFKTCPRCGDEFMQHIAQCPDCRVPLQASDGAPAPAAERRATTRASAGEAALGSAIVLRRGIPSELRQLAEALSAAGIPCAVDTDPPGAGVPGGASRGGANSGKEVQLAVYVSMDDAPAASAVQAQWLRASMPEADFVSAPLIEGACSGCSEPLPDNAAECPSCGLFILPLEVACPRCAQPVAVEAESCTHCGHRP